MTIRSAILLGVAAMFLATPAAVAASVKKVSIRSGGIPTIDLQLRCRKSEKTLMEMMGNNAPQAFDGCITSEQAARKALEDAWPKIPADIKGYCIRPADYSPSYVEWIACLEM